MTTLADLIAKVAAEHVRYDAEDDDYGPRCEACWQRWGESGCDAARLAAALSVENVAAGLRETGIGRDSQPVELDTPERCAAALLAAITVETQASEPVSHAHVDVVGWTCPRCGHVS